MAVNRKILFFNAKREKCDSISPHLGLAMLAAVLKKKGHEVLMVDYQFKHTAPSPGSFIKDFNTLPLGYNFSLDELLEQGKIQFTRQYHLKRISRNNNWIKVDWDKCCNEKYDFTHYSAKALFISP